MFSKKGFVSYKIQSKYPRTNVGPVGPLLIDKEVKAVTVTPAGCRRLWLTLNFLAFPRKRCTQKVLGARNNAKQQEQSTTQPHTQKKTRGRSRSSTRGGGLTPAAPPLSDRGWKPLQNPRTYDTKQRRLSLLTSMTLTNHQVLASCTWLPRRLQQTGIALLLTASPPPRAGGRSAQPQKRLRACRYCTSSPASCNNPRAAHACLLPGIAVQTAPIYPRLLCASHLRRLPSERFISPLVMWVGGARGREGGVVY